MIPIAQQIASLRAAANTGMPEGLSQPQRRILQTLTRRWMTTAGDHWDTTRLNVVCKNLGPLHGKAAADDYHVGGTFHYDPSRFELLGSVKPPLQLELL